MGSGVIRVTLALITGRLLIRRRATYEPYWVDADEQATDEPVRTFRMRELDGTEHDDFEKACATLLTRDGFRGVERVGKTGDLGEDVRASDALDRKIVVQCKHYRKPVGSQDPQRFNGTARPVHRADVPVFIALNGFTQPAIDFARNQAIALIDRPELKRWAYDEDLYTVLSDQLDTTHA